MADALFTLRFEVPNLYKASKIIGDAHRRFNDWRAAWKALEPYVGAAYSSVLSSQGAAIGAHWLQLAAATLKHKLRVGGGALVSSGKLAALIGDGAAARQRLTWKSAKWGPNERYQFVQHFGSQGAGRKRATKIPGRQFIAWTPALQNTANQIVNEVARGKVQQLSEDIETALAEGTLGEGGD